jgi:hypothetical protein
MRVRTRIIPLTVRASYTPEQIVGRGIVLIFALVGLIDLFTMGAMWK